MENHRTLRNAEEDDKIGVGQGFIIKGVLAPYRARASPVRFRTAVHTAVAGWVQLCPGHTDVEFYACLHFVNLQVSRVDLKYVVRTYSFELL